MVSTMPEERGEEPIPLAVFDATPIYLPAGNPTV